MGGELNFTTLWDTPTVMDTVTFSGFYLTDTVESVADPDWKRAWCIYCIQLWSAHVFTVHNFYDHAYK